MTIPLDTPDPNQVQQTPEMSAAIEQMLYGHADGPNPYINEAGNQTSSQDNPEYRASSLTEEEQATHDQAVRDQHAYELAIRQREIEHKLIHEDTKPSSHVDGFDFSAAAMAALTFTIVVALAFFAQKLISNMETKPAQTGVVIEQQAEVPAARVPEAIPAYPTVEVRQSSDPSQAPSPLPPSQETK